MNPPPFAILESVANDLGTDLTLNQAAVEIAPFIPDPLRILYAQHDGGNVLIGDLYRQTQIIEARNEEPFFPNWIPFGGTHYGVFWLCATVAHKGRWFTTWDHDLEVEIDEPVFSNLSDFFSNFYDSALELREGDNNFLVVESVPQQAKTKTIAQIKKLTGRSSRECLSMLASLPLKLPVSQALTAKQSMDLLRNHDVKCHLQLAFF